MLTRWRAVRMGHRAPATTAPATTAPATTAPATTATSDRGMTLVELAVGMTLLGIVGAIAVNFFVSNAGQADRVGEESLVAADARVAAENIGSMLRLADTPTARAGFTTGRFEVLTPTRIVFYSNIASSSRSGDTSRTPPSRIDISLVDGSLVQKTYAPKTNYTTYPASYDYTTNYPTTPTSVSTLVRTLVNPTGVPIFTYCSSATEPAATCTTAANANAVAAVGIDLTVPGKNGTTPQRLMSVVAITGAVS